MSERRMTDEGNRARCLNGRFDRRRRDKRRVRGGSGQAAKDGAITADRRVCSGVGGVVVFGMRNRICTQRQRQTNQERTKNAGWMAS